MVTANTDLREEDLRQVSRRGLQPDEVRRQLQQLRHPPAPLVLDRPCTVRDGIHVLGEDEARAASLRFDEARERGRFLKFVPASGAASRMFQSLLVVRSGREVRRDEIAKRAAAGDATAAEVLEFMDGIRRFAFFDELRESMRAGGFELEALAARGQFGAVIEHLLTPAGLGYAERPKGLLQFHRYAGACRTAFEEHLVESAGYCRDRDGVCRLHFTVSPQHREGFRSLLERVRPVYERRYQARFEVEFSVQKSSTDTVAVDTEGRPFRTTDGKLLFRPGGHGALIENLSDLRADVIFVKNIDNVVPDHLKDATIEWKKRIAGHLLSLQEEVFGHLAALRQVPAAHASIERAARFASERLMIPLPAAIARAADAERKAFLIRKLDRPIRVCGIVRNTGEPGGGPFWVRERDGTASLQIVESSQVDPRSPAQLAVFRSSTHFNPVDLVCGVRDRRGEPFDLRRYVDEDAVFISRKSQDGRGLKALELPGLWNGAMADWITVFVEVPIETFNPVKTVVDLLRREHQPGPGAP